MTTLRQFSVFDMLHYNNVNLDILTETFSTYFYAKYLIKWPEYCVSLWNCTGDIQAYRISVLKKSWARSKEARRKTRNLGMDTSQPFLWHPNTGNKA